MFVIVFFSHLYISDWLEIRQKNFLIDCEEMVSINPQGSLIFLKKIFRSKIILITGLKMSAFTNCKKFCRDVKL